MKFHLHSGKRLNAVRKQYEGHESAHFSLIAVAGYRSHAVIRVELGYFVLFRTSNTIAYFTVKTKAYNVIISRTVQLLLLFKKLFLFA